MHNSSYSYGMCAVEPVYSGHHGTNPDYPGVLIFQASLIKNHLGLQLAS